MPRALITGVTGQDGLYLSELLLAKGYEVYGLDPRAEQPQARLVERAFPGCGCSPATSPTCPA